MSIKQNSKKTTAKKKTDLFLFKSNYIYLNPRKLTLDHNIRENSQSSFSPGSQPSC